MQEIELIVMM